MAGAAKVNVKEIDQSTRVGSFPGLYTAIVIPAYKGPVNKPVLVSSTNQLLRNFTPNNTIEVGYDLSFYSALNILENTDKLWVVRAANQALFAGSTIREQGLSVDSSSWSSGMEDAEDYLFDAAPDSVATAQQTVISTIKDVVEPATSELTDIILVADVVTNAVAEVTTINTTDAAGSTGAYVLAYAKESVSSAVTNKIAFWYSLDGVGTPPAATQTASIEVALVTGDLSTVVATKLMNSMNSYNGGLSFRATVVGNVVTITNLVLGAVPDSSITPPSAGIVGTVTQGANAVSSLDRKYFFMYGLGGQVAFWYDMTGSSTPPTQIASASRSVRISNVPIGSSVTQIATLTAQTITSDASFNASAFSNTISVTNTDAGNLTDASDGNTGYSFTVKKQGTKASSSLDGKCFLLQDNQGTVGVWLDVLQAKETTAVTCLGDVAASPAVAEVTSITVNTPALHGKFFTLFSGATASVAFYYNVDGIVLVPVTGATRSVLISILSADSNDDIATKTQLAINGDASFTATVLASVVTVTNNTAGAVPDVIDTGATNFVFSITTQGSNAIVANSVEGKLLYIYSPGTTAAPSPVKVGVWYSTGITSTPPNNADTLIPVIVTVGDVASVIATKTAAAIAANSLFVATSANDVVTIIAKNPGNATDSVDVSTGFIMTKISDGSEPPPVLTAEGATVILSVPVVPGSTAAQVATAVANTLNSYSQYTASATGITVSILDNQTGFRVGPTKDINTKFTLTVTVEGAADVTATDELFIIYASSPGFWGNSVSFSVVNHSTAPDIVKYPNAFMIYVYNEGSLAESFLCSRDQSAKDGYGRSMYIEDVLNSSLYIRAMNNDAVGVTHLPKENLVPILLGGGDNGYAVADSQMITALNTMMNAQDLPVNIVVDGGRTTQAWQKALNGFSSNRKDCFAVLSIPFSAENTQDYISAISEYKKNLAMESSYAAIYSSHQLIYDSYTGRDIWISPESFAAQRLNYTAQQFEPWYPAAGTTRGVVNSIDTKLRFTQGEMDYLYNMNINPIKWDSINGIIIWGQKTLQSKPSALDRINVRMLLIVIEPALKKTLESYLFELNDTTTRSVIVSVMANYMQSIQARRGVTSFRVVADSTNNTPSDVANGILNVDLYITPTTSLEEINLSVIITSQGVQVTV